MLFPSHPPIFLTVFHMAFLDEIPGAYKPIDVVMADVADLVEVKHTLRQIVNVKGD